MNFIRNYITCSTSGCTGCAPFILLKQHIPKLIPNRNQTCSSFKHSLIQLPSTRYISTQCNNNLQKSASFSLGGSLNTDAEKVVELLKSDECSNILVMAGAGLST